MLRNFRIRGVRMLLGAAALLVTAGGIAYATIPSSSGVISGCYEKRTGLLRVIDASAGAKCTRFEVPISWNQTGQRGEQGVQGLRGPTGLAGPTGADGAAGPTGPAGSDGARGQRGPTGAAGAVGGGSCSVGFFMVGISSYGSPICRQIALQTRLESTDTFTLCSTTDSCASQRRLVVTCEPGWELTGGGYSTTGGDVTVDYNRAELSATDFGKPGQWAVVATNHAPFAGGSVAAYANCLKLR